MKLHQILPAIFQFHIFGLAPIVKGAEALLGISAPAAPPQAPPQVNIPPAPPPVQAPQGNAGIYKNNQGGSGQPSFLAAAAAPSGAGGKSLLGQ